MPLHNNSLFSGGRWNFPKWQLEIQVTLKLRGICSKPEQNKEHIDTKEIYAKEFMKMSYE